MTVETHFELQAVKYLVNLSQEEVQVDHKLSVCVCVRQTCKKCKKSKDGL